MSEQSWIESTARVIGERGRKILLAMKEEYSFPISMLASETKLSKTAVRRTLKTMRQFDLVFIQPWFDEDDIFIRGSGYFLSGKGLDVREHIEKDWP